MHIAIIGTGRMARGIAYGLRVTTHDITLGSREPAQAEALAKVMSEEHGRRYRGTGHGAAKFQTTYNYASQVTSQSDGMGNLSTFQFNSVGLVSSITGPDPDGSGPNYGATTVFAFDTLGRKTVELCRSPELTHLCSGKLTHFCSSQGCGTPLLRVHGQSRGKCSSDRPALSITYNLALHSWLSDNPA